MVDKDCDLKSPTRIGKRKKHQPLEGDDLEEPVKRSSIQLSSCPLGLADKEDSAGATEATFSLDNMVFKPKLKQLKRPNSLREFSIESFDSAQSSDVSLDTGLPKNEACPNCHGKETDPPCSQCEGRPKDKASRRSDGRPHIKRGRVGRRHSNMEVMTTYFAQKRELRRRSSYQEIKNEILLRDSKGQGQSQKGAAMEEEGTSTIPEIPPHEFKTVTPKFKRTLLAHMERSQSADGYDAKEKKDHIQVKQALLFDSTPDLSIEENYVRFPCLRNKRRGAISSDIEESLNLLRDMNLNDSDIPSDSIFDSDGS